MSRSENLFHTCVLISFLSSSMQNPPSRQIGLSEIHMYIYGWVVQTEFFIIISKLTSKLLPFFPGGVQ